MKQLTVLIAVLLLAGSCKKPEVPCTGPGDISIVSGGIVKWTNKTKVTIEVKGISWPGHGLMTPNDLDEYRIEGHALIRVRTECSPWSAWYEINKP